MNALADAAFLSSPDPHYNNAYDEAQLEAMGAVGMAAAMGNGPAAVAMPVNVNAASTT